MDTLHRQWRRCAFLRHAGLSALLVLSLLPQTASAQTFLACYARGTGTVYRTGEVGAPADCVAPAHVPFSWKSFESASLPFQASVQVDAPGPEPFQIRNSGTGPVAFFSQENPASVGFAVRASTVGSGAAIGGWSGGTGFAARFDADGSATAGGFFGHGTGPALMVALDEASTSDMIASFQVGAERMAFIDRSGNLRATRFQGFNNNSTGFTALFRTENTANTSATVRIRNQGIGPALQAGLGASSTGTLIAEFFRGDTDPDRLKASIDRDGNAFFRGSVTAAEFLAAGADIAEAFEVEGEVAAYEPGDVLVISQRSDRRVERSGEAYSTRVIGVYATEPGVLLSEGSAEPGREQIPVGVIGVIPTKVSTENGAIRRGDILVTAGTAGHAMRATPVEINGVVVYPGGTILGKAIEEFPGPGVGMIRVLVNVR